MPKDWTRLANDAEHYEVGDFQRALYRVVTEQALYGANGLQRTAYRIIKEYEGAFREALSLLGMNLRVETNPDYCVAWPEQIHNTPLPLNETRLVLVLRKLYDQRMRAGEVEDGRAIVSVEELRLVYRQTTDKDLPDATSAIKAMMSRMKRFGIARTVDTESDDPEAFAVQILPAIEFLIGEAYLAHIDEYMRPHESRSGDEADEEEQEAVDEGN